MLHTERAQADFFRVMCNRASRTHVANRMTSEVNLRGIRLGLGDHRTERLDQLLYH